MPLSTGQVLNNRYRIVRLLGQGGFGAVYRAWDVNLERPLALKENLETSPEAQRQFKREAQILFDLSHPNLPKVIDYFFLPGQGQYLVMEFVEGQDLGQILQQAGAPLSEAQALPWIAQICDALAYLHSHTPPIIHRDIKPANIKITPGGRAMLVDFGIAKVFGAHQQTTVGARAVTPGYSPIEQYGSGGHTDARSDIYALGGTLYTLLTNQEPVGAPERNVGSHLAAPRAFNPALSEQIEAVILRAMAIRPQDRFPTAAEFKAALTPGAFPAGGGQSAAVHPAAAGSGGLVGTRGAAIPAYAGSAPAVTPSPAVAIRVPPSKPPAAPPARRSHTGAWIGVTLVFLLLAACVVLAAVWLSQNDAGSWSRLFETPQFINDRDWTATARVRNTNLARTSTGIARTRAARATSTPSATPEPPMPPGVITDDRGVWMAYVEAGYFQMGSETGEDVEKPVHSVYLDAFYIDVYEVTNASYAECVRAGPCTAPQATGTSKYGDYYGNSSFDFYPMVNVNWDQANEYCAWRGGRLPSEAEWEKAARGGLEQREYPWGDDAPVCTEGAYNGANYKECGIEDAVAVGSYAPNGYQLYDMAGNVWEWVWDWYGSDYYNSLSDWYNPFGPDSGELRVLRGGCWFNPPSEIRAAIRGRNEDYSYAWGLRCVRSDVTPAVMSTDWWLTALPTLLPSVWPTATP